MDKIKINEFLSFWKQIIIENPNLDFKKIDMTRTIYHYLIKLGVNEEEKEIKTNNFFDEWIKYFKDKNNINVFVSPNWKYFCQFTNGNVDNLDNFIKLYIPTNYNHLFKTAIELFNYLNENNISHLSKIGSEIRFDNIVIRLTNIEDAKKVVNFINSNPYIKEGLIKCNPFANSIDNISMVSDGYLSYNRVISTYIRLFLDNMKDNNSVNDINSDTFINFINNYYQNKFKNKNELIKEFELNHKEELNDLKNVTELIINTYHKNYSFDEYSVFFNKITNNNQLLNDDIETLLIEALEIMINKENKELALERIDYLLNTNDYGIITRNFGLRDRLYRNNFANRLKIFLNSKNISINNYINSLESKNNQIEELLKECIIIMSMKFGREITLENLYYFYITNNTTLITRTNNLRSKIENINFKEEIDKILNINKITFKEYLDLIIEKYSLNNEKRR